MCYATHDGTRGLYVMTILNDCMCYYVLCFALSCIIVLKWRKTPILEIGDANEIAYDTST